MKHYKDEDDYEYDDEDFIDNLSNEDEEDE